MASPVDTSLRVAPDGEQLHGAEPLSPELALVDPVLARRARAALPLRVDTLPARVRTLPAAARAGDREPAGRRLGDRTLGGRELRRLVAPTLGVTAIALGAFGLGVQVGGMRGSRITEAVRESRGDRPAPAARRTRRTPPAATVRREARRSPAGTTGSKPAEPPARTTAPETAAPRPSRRPPSVAPAETSRRTPTETTRPPARPRTESTPSPVRPTTPKPPAAAPRRPPTTQQPVAARVRRIIGDEDISGYAMLAPGKLAGALTTFGKPTSTRPNPGGCEVSWQRLGLKIVFAGSGARACAAPGGRFSGAVVAGDGWRTEKRLGIGSPVTRLRALYPTAEEYPGGWWALVIRRRKGYPYPGLGAKIVKGRVSAFYVQ